MNFNKNELFFFLITTNNSQNFNANEDVRIISIDL